MRDPILDRYVQPLVERTGLQARSTAIELSNVYGALVLIGAAHSFSRDWDLASAVIGVAFGMAATRLLRTGARYGSSILASRFGTVHFLLRILTLGFGLYTLTQTLIGLFLGIVPAQGDVTACASMLTMSACLYLGICDTPPKRRRQAFAYATARS